MTQEREAELLELVTDAHRQLYGRDNELLALIDRHFGARSPDLAEVGVGTVHVRQHQEELAERDRTIIHLTNLLDQQTAWATRTAQEVVARDETIRAQQAELTTLSERVRRVTWLLAAWEVAGRLRGFLNR